MGTIYRVISADSHLEVVPERWTPRVPAKYRDRSPRLVKLANGGDAILVENRPLQVPGLSLCGKRYEEYSPVGGVYETSPGTGSPEQRLKEQDQDGCRHDQLQSKKRARMPYSRRAKTPMGSPALDFESGKPVNYQHLSQHIVQDQRSFLSRVIPLCSVCAVGLGTILSTVGAYQKTVSQISYYEIDWRDNCIQSCSREFVSRTA